mgnify:FL=1
MAYNYITANDSPNFTPSSRAKAIYGYDRVIEGVTIHHWGNPADNPQFQNIVNYLCRNDGNTSAHYVATGTNRQVACIVSPNDVAWHSGTAWGNTRTIGIELDPRARDEDYDVAAELIADIRSAYGDVPIYWHSYFVATACPGAWNPDRLDKLSYTKFSADEWGKGGNKVVQPPVVTPPVTPTPKPLYKLTVGGKQVAAYSSDSNAYKGWVEYSSSGKITLDDKDVTQAILDKFAPSPTAGQPDTGKPVTEKHDYSEENNTLLKSLLALLQSFITKFNSIFK